MKAFIISGILCVSLATAAAAGQLPKYGVTVTAEKGVDFAKFHTYSWTAGQPSFDKTIDGQIKAAVDSELQGLGLTKAASGPGDVLVSYASLSRTDVDPKAKPDPQGTRAQSLVGTLVVSMQDPASRKRVLQLRADKPIDSERSQLELAIKALVTEMFAKYPTRAGK